MVRIGFNLDVVGWWCFKGELNGSLYDKIWVEGVVIVVGVVVVVEGICIDGIFGWDSV